MNVQDPRIRQELQEGLKWLPLSAKNEEVLLRYIFLPDRDDDILAQTEKASFYGISENQALFFYIPFMRMENIINTPVMERLLEFLWAVGGVSVAALLTKARGCFSSADSAGWRVKVLGAVPAAVLSAATVFASEHHTNRSMYWLLGAEPDVLRDAQALCTRVEEHAAALMSASLLRREDDPQQREALLRRVIDAVPKILFGLPRNQVEEMQDYIRRGDLNVPVPVLPALQLPAVDIASAQTATWMETYLLRTYAMAAMLTAHLDSRIRCALRFYLMLYPRRILYDAILFLPKEVRAQMPELLVRELPGGGVTMMLLAATYTEIYKNCREVCLPYLHEAMQHANPEQFMRLVKFEKGEGLSVEEVRVKLALGLSKCACSADEQEAYDYLMEQGDLTDAVARLRNIRPGFYRGLSHCIRLLREYILENGMDDFSLRCVTFAGLVFDNPDLFSLTWMPGGKTNSELLQKLLQQLCERGLPAAEVLGICDRVYENVYWDDHKAELRRAVLTLGTPERVGEFVRAMGSGSVFARTVALELLSGLTDAAGAKEAILGAAGDSSKQVRELVCRILSGHPEWSEDCKKLLSSKKAAVRTLAVEVLSRLGEREALEAALAHEKNAKVADAIRAALGASGSMPIGSAAQMAAELTKGNKLKKLSWLLDEQLISVRNTDGTSADDSIRNAILLSYSELGRIGRSETAAELAKALDRGDLEKLAAQVYDLWYASGAQAKHKWVLPFAAVFGGAAMTQRLNRAIHDWPEHQRGTIACDAVMALALSDDPAAIVIVDSLSRKFKFRQIKQAAAAALENAARELGITAEELADRIVPDLGFGRDGRRIFDYGRRSFTVRLTATLELQITNDQGKTVKNLPAPGKNDDPQAADAYEAFKTMKKQIRTTVSAQQARLEAALSVLRCWDTDRWKALFVENPIMHQFAMSLIWGIYEDGTLTDTFRYMEDGTFNTVDEDEFTLPEKAKIGLVHPVELDADTLQAWKQQLADYEIRQSIDQLDRTVHALDAGRAGEKALEDFGGKKLNALSLSGKLLQQGWYRGSVQDGGAFYCFWREDRELGIGAELRFSGTAVGYDDGENVTVYDAVFYTGTVNRGSYVYDTIPAENIVSLGDVPARYYSEIVHQLTRATASSTEQDENWKASRIDN